MPAYNWQLNDRQVADVLNYIRNSWGGAASVIEADNVSRVRNDTATRGD
jgi:mono/diheme cytochrome c family protein